MDLNKYSIEKLIEQSNICMSRKNKFLGKILLIVGGVALLGATVVTPLYKVVLLGLALSVFSKPTYEYLKCARKRSYASRKLKGVVKVLEKNGIHTTKLKLQKATIGTDYNYNEKKEARPFGIEEVQTAVFKDNHGQLKALQQIRSEILWYSCNSFGYLCNTKKEEKGVCIKQQRTEFINDSRKVKQLYLEMKKR